MDFDDYIKSFKRKEIAQIWFHMTAMTLVIARKSSAKSLLVVEGAEREDEEGELTTEPLVLGEINDENRLKEVASLILANYQDIAIEGDYSWDLVTKTEHEIESNLWSICWMTTENDYARSLPNFLMRLTPSQIEVIKQYFADPNDKRLLDLSNVIQQNHWSESDEFVQSIINKFITSNNEFSFDGLIRFLDEIEME
jgi:hypothetical protein